MRYFLFVFCLLFVDNAFSQNILLAKEKYVGGPNVVKTFTFEVTPFNKYSVYYTGYTIVDTILFYIGSETLKYYDRPKSYEVINWSLTDSHTGNSDNYRVSEDFLYLTPVDTSYFSFDHNFPYSTTSGLVFDFVTTACSITVVVQGNKIYNTAWDFEIFEEEKSPPRDTVIVIDEFNNETSFNYTECNNYDCFVRCTTFIDGSSYIPNSIKQGDIFYPMAEVYHPCLIDIYDRWGNLLRHCVDTWTVDLPPGVYVYHIRYTLQGRLSSKLSSSGSITVFK